MCHICFAQKTAIYMLSLAICFFLFFVNWIGVALSNNISTWTSLRLGLVQYMFFLCQKFWLTPSINQSVNQLLTHQSISCFFDCNNITFLHVMVIKKCRQNNNMLLTTIQGLWPVVYCIRISHVSSKPGLCFFITCLGEQSLLMLTLGPH